MNVTWCSSNGVVSQVKVLYVRNLMLSTSETQILEVFTAYGCVERVKKIKDYAFVHFQLREEAQKAMEAINGTGLVFGSCILHFMMGNF